MHLCPKVSIIIPVYNTASYLPLCFQSLVNQSYTSLEIIFINDGSSDNSLTLINSFIANNPQLECVLINQEHKGPSVARNNGIDQATGDLILFLDSDDSLSYHAISSLVELSNDVDIVVGGKEIIYKGSIIRTDIPTCAKIQTRDEVIISALKRANNAHMATCKLYRTSVIKENNIRFIENRIYEDIAFTYACLLHATKISFLPQCIYSCTVRNDSIMRNISNRNIVDYVFMMDYTTNLLLSSFTSSFFKKDLLNFLSHGIMFIINMFFQANIDFDSFSDSINYVLTLLYRVKLLP